MVARVLIQSRSWRGLVRRFAGSSDAVDGAAAPVNSVSGARIAIFHMALAMRRAPTEAEHAADAVAEGFA